MQKDCRRHTPDVTILHEESGEIKIGAIRDVINGWYINHLKPESV